MRPKKNLYFSFKSHIMDKFYLRAFLLHWIKICVWCKNILTRSGLRDQQPLEVSVLRCCHPVVDFQTPRLPSHTVNPSKSGGCL
ncbi:unnamed protein product [Nezara viridula]|uniref:Uncharacterized protein n=1 Tax=Nezara viridula TaxID=85310 RepID=A0A9P0H8R0_NEZVI|nr:unnamed protein product [Nezara viridula]